MKILSRQLLWFFVFNLWGGFCFAQTLDGLSYDDLVGRCSKAVVAKPYLISSKVVKGPKNQTAQTWVRCWKEKDRHFALSELWVDGKKVYATPRNALAPEVACGTAAGEVYKPHSFSPSGNYFAFLLVPFCWETEPLAPVVMLNRYSDKNTKAPNFTPIAKEIFRRYPKAALHKKEIDFVSSIVGWEGKEKLLIDVEVICYGCMENGALLSFPKTRWSLTPEDR